MTLLASLGALLVPGNIVGALLILVGFACLILEIKITSHGILTVGGIVAVVLGLWLLDESTLPVRMLWLTVLPAFAAAAVITGIMTAVSLKTRLLPPRGDSEDMIGRTVKVASPLEPVGTVLVDGVLWDATAPVPVREGADVRIVAVNRLMLRVVPA